ncbi:MBOAT family O-acyltransferase [Butyrivibrio sp. VCB2006]|uniref:MBOAT family O-acyltransferase n=1 Tax=Butyrivibrio sp. VCB2006 TaxID=1280679 RepID=UPI0004276D49|nr:MBOAT family O-acyltransferase [Butyrivibrio sp. VCB2006]
MPVYTKLYGLFFLTICVIFYSLAYLIKDSANRSVVSRVLLLCADLVFYAYAGVTFLPALLYVVVVTYLGGLLLGKRGKLFPLFCTLLFAPLVAYKFLQWNQGDFIIPLGISFFTLQAYSYLNSVYKKDAEPERSFLTVAVFVSFFPAVSSGPILRSSKIIPQLKAPKDFEYDRVTDGMKLYCLGLFKKMVLADNLALYIQSVNEQFALGNVHGLAVITAAIFYSLQLYLDFSGYSDIVIGCSKVLGFDIDRNFDHPYMARTITEFWRRWHISLSSWLRDYIYFPLGGSKRGAFRTYINILIVFVISGLWHGNGLNYIVWGLLHGLFQCVERALKAFTHGKYKGSRLVTFVMVTFAWMFFAEKSVGDALGKIRAFSIIPRDISEVFSGKHLLVEALQVPQDMNFLMLVVGIVIFALVSVITYEKDGLELIRKIPAVPRWVLYNLLILGVLFFSASTQVSFIYNKF